MNDSLPKLAGGPGHIEWFRRRLPKPDSLRRRLRQLKWLIPIALVLLVLAYELGPARWTYQGLGFNYHLLLEIIVFGTVGPLLAYVMLVLLGRWIEEKDTADLQAHLLAQANEKQSEARQLNDNTVQVLFATSLLMTTIKSDGSDLSPATMAQIDTTERALKESLDQLVEHLTS